MDFAIFYNMQRKTGEMICPEPFSLKEHCRITGLDIARSLALFYMTVVNFWSIVQETVPGWVNVILLKIQGKAAVTFIIIAGMALSLISKHQNSYSSGITKSEFRSKLLKRALFLFIIGTLNTFFWITDILHFYAFFLIISVLFLYTSSTKIWVFQLLCIFIFLFLIPWKGDITCKSYLAFNYSYFLHLSEILQHFFIDGCYAFFPWFAFFTLGLWLGRQKITCPAVRRKMFFWGLGMVLLFEGVSFYIIDLDYKEILYPSLGGRMFWFVIDPWKPTPFFIFSATGSALFIVGISMILAEKVRNKKLLLPFSYTGKTTLTLYILQLLCGQFVWKQINQTSLNSVLFIIIGTVFFTVFSLVFSCCWGRRFRRGPVELLLHWFVNIKIMDHLQRIPVLVKQIVG
jgi:uncharacterized membrane protein YeiB